MGTLEDNTDIMDEGDCVIRLNCANIDPAMLIIKNAFISKKAKYLVMVLRDASDLV